MLALGPPSPLSFPWYPSSQCLLMGELDFWVLGTLRTTRSSCLTAYLQMAERNLARISKIDTSLPKYVEYHVPVDAMHCAPCDMLSPAASE